MRFSSMLLVFFMLMSHLKAQHPNLIPEIETTVSGEVSNGFILLSLFNLDMEAEYSSGLLILDSVGNPVVFQPHSTPTDSSYLQQIVVDFDLEPDGTFSYFFRRLPATNILFFTDRELQIIDSLKCDDHLSLDPHDVIREADGTTHYLCFDRRIMDASSLTTVDSIPGSDTASVEGNAIIRMAPNGSIEWEWFSLDNYAISDTYEEYFINPLFLDHTHYNSIEIDVDGNYMMSARHLNEIAKINSSTGEIMWQLGGKNNDFQLIGDTVWFTGQHDARRLPNGDISLFDNATQTANGTARALQYTLDTMNMTATVSWEKKLESGHKSLFIGSNRLLPNGNRIINWGGARPFEETISSQEVDSNGNSVLTLDFPSNFISYRTVKTDLPDLELPTISCANQTLIAPISSYYLWNTGDTTETISVSDTGHYFVWIIENGVYKKSKPHYISDVNNVCNTVSVGTQSNGTISIYPQPALNDLHVEYEMNQERSLSLFDLNGNQLPIVVKTATPNSVALSVTTLPAGIYILKVGEKVMRVTVL